MGQEYLPNAIADRLDETVLPIVLGGLDDADAVLQTNQILEEL
jgi:hypothetical protein